MRWAISAGALLLWLAWKRRLPAAAADVAPRWPDRGLGRADRHHVFYFLENLALRYTTATNAGVLSNFIPVFLVLIGTVWLRERLTGVEWGAWQPPSPARRSSARAPAI